MRHAVTLFLDTDTVDWLDIVAKNLSRQRHKDTSRSEAMEHIVRGHWIKTHKRAMDKKHEKSVALRAARQ